MTAILAPKQSCPIDLGYWYCDDCERTQTIIDELLELECSARLSCGRVIDSLICGKTHQGYQWCEECREQGTLEPKSHFGEFETVGVFKE